jgi:salicylate hydroxylase
VGTLVVGGGIGGLATALALSRCGISVDLVEDAAEFGEIGAGIQLAPNALRVLDWLGIMDRVLENGVFPQQGVMMSAVSGQRLAAVDFGEQFRRRYGYPYIVTHRSDLLDALVDACRAAPEVTLHNGKRAVDLAESGNSMRVSCADGTELIADAVIGADGIRSVVREFTVADGPPVCSGDIAYRGTAPIEAVHDAAGLDNVVWWIGPNMHLIQYPIRRGELFNQVAVFTSDRYRPGIAEDEWGTVEELDRRFAGTVRYVAEGIKLINRDRHWKLHDRESVSSWTRGRATLLGDAAHAMMQYLAQGACQALEDARCLAETMSTLDDVTSAFEMYQKERIPRTARVQQWSRWMGDIVHADNPHSLVRDALLEERHDNDYAYFDWLYGSSDA